MDKKLENMDKQMRILSDADRVATELTIIGKGKPDIHVYPKVYGDEYALLIHGLGNADGEFIRSSDLDSMHMFVKGMLFVTKAMQDKLLPEAEESALLEAMDIAKCRMYKELRKEIKEELQAQMEADQLRESIGKKGSARKATKKSGV